MQTPQQTADATVNKQSLRRDRRADAPADAGGNGANAFNALLLYDSFIR